MPSRFGCRAMICRARFPTAPADSTKPINPGFQSLTTNLLYVRRFILLAIFRIFNRYYFARPRVLSQQIQSVAQNFLLQIAHARTAETVSDFEAFRIERAWWTHLG